MKRILQINLLFAAVFLFAIDSFAQLKSVLGPRFFVNSPSGISGFKKFTYSSSSTTTAWGRALDSTWWNVEVVKAQQDTLGCTTISGSYNNKWVLIWRGNCQFGEKALYAQQKGAKGVIIINQNPGAGPVGMAAGTSGGSVTIPVLMVGNLDGIAMWNALGSGQLFVSITSWGFGLNNDLSIVPTSPAPGANAAVPLTQMVAGATGTPYNFYSGAFIANTGLNNQTNIKLIADYTFTPTGGSATNIGSDTMGVATFNTTDSIFQLISSGKKNFTPTGKGVYKINYTLSSSATDDNNADNTESVTMEVTDNIFCKTPVDGTGMPVTNSGLRINSQIPITWGPMFYIAKGGHKAQSVRWNVSDNDTSKHSLSTSASAGTYSAAYVFKWVDGSSGSPTDGIMQAKELTLAGAAVRNFTTADSPSKNFLALVGDENGNTKTVTLDAGAWYWVGVELPNAVYLGCNQDMNYYNRSNAAQSQSTSILDFWAPLLTNPAGTISASSTDTLRMIPYGSSTAFAWNIDSATYSSVRGSVPGVALELSPFPVSVSEKTVADKQITLYPNPATNVVNVDLKLNDKAKKATIKIIDAFGRTVTSVEKSDVKSDILTFSTSALASGNYYVVVVTENKTMFRGFTVNNK